MKCLLIHIFVAIFASIVQAKQIKVLVPSLMNGSWERLSMDVAYDLAQDSENRFNVTVLGARDLNVKTNDNLNVIRIDFDREELLPVDNHSDKNLPMLLPELEKNKTEYFFKGNQQQLIQDLKDMDFDVCFATTVISEGYVCRNLEIQTMRHFSALPEPMVSVANNEPIKSSFSYLITMPNQWFSKTFAWDSPVQRFVKSAVNFLFGNVMMNTNKYDNYMMSYYKNDRTKLRDSLIAGFGTEGLSDVVPHAPNVVTWTPLTSKGSKFVNAESLKELPQEYNEHLSKFNQTILIAFGTTWAPEKAAIKKILASVEQMPDHGFIMGLKESIPYYDMVMAYAEKLPNLMVRGFIPQPKLLADERVTAFMTHCGMNSMIEAAYFGKPVFGMPIAMDQFAMCQRAEEMDIGYHFDLKDSSKKMTKWLKNISNPEHRINKTAKRVGMDLSFQELRGGQDLKYWVEYGAKHGFEHMIPQVDFDNDFQRNDYDIVLIYSVIFGLLFYTAITILRYLGSFFRRSKK